MIRPPWSDFRAALESAGFRPSKTLGQNFLLDDNMARSLVADAGVGADDRVVEIGAGCGFLTVHLAEACAAVVAVEVDRRLFQVASELLAPWENVRLVRADALAGKHVLGPELCGELDRLGAAGPWHVVANLPYSISGPLFVLLSRREPPPASISALVQREVAEKAAGRPGTRDWGALAARLAVRYRPRLGRRVPAALFWPRPRVESRVVHLERLPGDGPDAAALERYDRLVDLLFQSRRKTLRATLAARLGRAEPPEEALARVGLDPGARPEEVAAADLLRLAEELGERLAGKS
ncbi:MAG: 16S rRNA (adenine(1518)-N(6)/adenine(1519)-N(6))-dimethyltransferase RsmA [Planctomycetota bacterium]